jgi:hypothetical protein
MPSISYIMHTNTELWKPLTLTTHKSKQRNTFENYYIKFFHQHNIIIWNKPKKKNQSPIQINYAVQVYHACMHVTSYLQTSSQIFDFISELFTVQTVSSLTTLVCTFINHHSTFLNIFTWSRSNNVLT